MACLAKDENSGDTRSTMSFDRGVDGLDRAEDRQKHELDQEGRGRGTMQRQEEDEHQPEQDLVPERGLAQEPPPAVDRVTGRRKHMFDAPQLGRWKACGAVGVGHGRNVRCGGRVPCDVGAARYGTQMAA